MRAEEGEPGNEASERCGFSLKLKAILRFFKCMESMARDMRHPYIPSLGDHQPFVRLRSEGYGVVSFVCLGPNLLLVQLN